MKIYLIATIKVKPKYLTDLKSVLAEMMLQTPKESANTQYDLHQSINDENISMFHEIWESQENLNLHNRQPYIKEFGNLVEEKLLEKPVIYLTKKL